MKRLSLWIVLVATASMLSMTTAIRVTAQPDKPKQEAKGRGFKPLSPERRKVLQEANQKRHGSRIRMLARNQTLPPAFDCRASGWDTPTWDQGSCGSCYLVSTVRTMTCAFVKAGYGKPDNSFMLASQFGMDCHNFGGCGGGNGTEVVEWAKNNGWYAEIYTDFDGKIHKDYPVYQARESSCRVPAGAKKWTIADWGFITNDGSFDVNAMKAAMCNYGVLNVALDAGGQFSDASGTITSMGRSIDHEITVVAYDDAKDGGAVLLKNQWGSGWGQDGCCWCTYGACKNIVDWFWVSAAPLPPPPTVNVPDVVGKSIDDATATLKSSGLLATIQGGTTGTIGSQVPVAGTSVATGSTVVLNVGPPPPPPPAVVWSGTFNRDWPKGKPFLLPIDAKKGDVLQLLRRGQTNDEPPMADPDDPFTPTPMKEKRP